MNKRVKWIIVGAAAVLALGGAAAALMLTAPEEKVEETSEAEVTSRLIYEKKPEDLKKLTVKNESGGYEIVSDGHGSFTIEELKEAPLDTDSIASAADKACSVTIQDTVAENAPDLSIYGLDSPRAEVRVEFGDSQGTVKEFLVGDVSPKSSKTYFSFKGENDVYLINTTDINGYLKKEFDFIEKEVFPSASSDGTTPAIEEIIISRRDIPYAIEISYDERQDDDSVMSGNSSTHVMVAPVKLDLNPDTSSDVLNGLYGLTALEPVVVAPTEEQLAEYGLTDDTCFGKMAMKLTDGIFRMTFGNEFKDESDEGYYCYVNGFDVIYKFRKVSLPWATVMPLDITTTMITSNYIFDITSMEIKTADRTYGFTMTGAGNDDFVVKLDGKDVELDRFKTFYQFVLRTAAEELYLEETDKEPYLTVTINAKNGNTDVVEFIADSDRMTIIRLNGNANFRCRTAYTDRLLENLNILENGGEFITTW